MKRVEVETLRFCPLTQLVVQRPSGQERMDPELEEVPDGSRSLVLPVVGEDLLDHEAPVAVSSAVRVNFRGVEKRHLQQDAEAAAGLRTTRCLQPSQRPAGPAMLLPGCSLIPTGTAALCRAAGCLLQSEAGGNSFWRKNF